MASVSSLDKDMRNIRLSKYTPQAANEVRIWIQDVLGERLADGDLLEALKDGIALCKLVNLAAPPGVRFKDSSMPFVQMENISHFLRACQSPPLNLQSHDIFQTVDLYESKDPAQVLQCISSFSRRAHAVQPSKFSSTIGGDKSKTGIISPQSTGGFSAARYGRPRGISNSSEASSATSHQASHQASKAVGGRGSPSISDNYAEKTVNGALPASSSGGVSSWSKKGDEGATTPAWNIHQYGYMGGASQGNQGISFGGRRQITTPAPKVPSLAGKERKKREQEAEDERLRLQADEAEHKRRVEREAEEERERLAEEQRWEEETARKREIEKRRVEEEKRRWDEEERKWKEEEEIRAKEEAEAEIKTARQRQGKIQPRPQLQGQYLSQYKAEQLQKPPASSGEDPERAPERDRVEELEKQLAEAKEREAKYERERQERLQADQVRNQEGTSWSSANVQQDRPRSRSRPAPAHSHQDSEDSRRADERDYLRKEWSSHNAEPAPPQQPPRPLPKTQDLLPPQPPRPLPSLDGPPQQPPRPLPTPQASSPPPISSLPPRPLPNPASYASSPRQPSPQRKSPFARPTSPAISTPIPPPQSQSASTPTKKPPFAKPSSLLSREMELDRLRQQEWEEAQRATKAAAASGVREGGVGPGDGSWDVNQYGYLGGDSQNRGGAGIGFGARRQIIGPRDPPGKS
ncbi:hypothetical protein HO133_005682 [Letharia lupina]|uniref:Calponin-homology (CH) domain-containing protein n=1 Tax=Letharia lupina TaxID=560253 RepID=A0A8H6C7M0_9LECA|nr:uncharacterized protein HO133_005682 [Letharia lupina]KAF6218335.1 hypothetical protein HO133_005682 [Letharia lupina]